MEWSSLHPAGVDDRLGNDKKVEFVHFHLPLIPLLYHFHLHRLIGAADRVALEEQAGDFLFVLGDIKAGKR